MTDADALALAFNSRRSPVLARGGMVATSQPLAVAAGLSILSAGGNAADAAIATAAALNVTEPTSTGIGGDAFALYYDAATNSVSALNGSGRAPEALDLSLLAREGFTDTLPRYHAHTITVPGACSAWCDLVETKGRLDLPTVLAPAIRLAEEGFPVAPVTAHFWAGGAARQLAQAPNGHELTIEGRAPRAGEIFRNPGLGRTFRAIANEGSAAFYEGPIADALVAVQQSAGGVLSKTDLSSHRSEWVEPIQTLYRGHRIWECPPNGQGLAALIGLNILEGFDPEFFSGASPTTTQLTNRLHLQIEAMRLAFADTRWYTADPSTNPAPLAGLLSTEYAARRRAMVDPTRANQELAHGHPIASNDTVYLSVVDSDGNACSFINSNYMGFGTGIVPKGWGFTLQNRGAGFSLDPDHPNALAPNKRPYHTIIPGLITRQRASTPQQDSNALTTLEYGHGGADPTGLTLPSNETFHASFGVMGGFMQPQGHLQVVNALIDGGLDPQAALDRLRFCIGDGTSGGDVSLEEGIPVSVMAELSRRGHGVRPAAAYGRGIFGRGQIILRAPNGVLWGGSDPRTDGCAMGLV
jgi:gamma-glutamyltranspeptidase/glutathione hydrolase